MLLGCRIGLERGVLSHGVRSVMGSAALDTGAVRFMARRAQRQLSNAEKEARKQRDIRKRHTEAERGGVFKLFYHNFLVAQRQKMMKENAKEYTEYVNKHREEMDKWAIGIRPWQPEGHIPQEEIEKRTGFTWENEAIDLIRDPTTQKEYDRSKRIRVEAGRGRRIVFQHPETYHSLALRDVKNLYQMLEKWEHIEEIRGAIMGSEGTKSFCSGMDFIEFSKYDANQQREFFKYNQKLHYFFQNSRIPIVSFPKGLALGSGAALALGAPIPFFTDKTSIAVSNLAFGHTLDSGLSKILSKMGPLGKFIALTSYEVTGRDLYALGLIDFYGPAEIENILQQSLSTTYSLEPNRVIYAILACSQPPISGFTPLEPYFSLIEKCFQFDTIEEIMSALEKDMSNFALQQLEAIKKMCPLSVKVTLEMLKRAKTLSLKQCMEMEYGITLRMMELPEFQTGLKCKVVRRGKAALEGLQWRSFEEISDAYVQELFNFKESDIADLALSSVLISKRRAPIRALIPSLLELNEVLDCSVRRKADSLEVVSFEEIQKEFFPETIGEIDVSEEIHPEKPVEVKTSKAPELTMAQVRELEMERYNQVVIKIIEPLSDKIGHARDIAVGALSEELRDAVLPYLETMDFDSLHNFEILLDSKTKEVTVIQVSDKESPMDNLQRRENNLYDFLESKHVDDDSSFKRLFEPLTDDDRR